jgi:hypothetical protein
MARRGAEIAEKKSIILTPASSAPLRAKFTAGIKKSPTLFRMRL